jgi:hypothetical protein
VNGMTKLAHIRNGWIYVLIFAVVFFSILVPIALPIPVQPQTRKAFDKVNALPAGSNAFIWMSYGSGATAELNPMFDALVTHLMERGVNIVIASRTVDALQVAWKEMQTEVAAFPDYAKGYGSKWVVLGWNPSPDVAIRQATSNIATAYNNVDFTGKALTDMPLIKQAPALTAQSYALGIVMDDTDGYLQWINRVGQPENLPPLVGAIQMEVPVVSPYVNTGQIGAIIPGANGAAQYEVLLHHPGGALRTQNTASLAALLVVVLLILGNLGFVAERRQKAA